MLALARSADTDDIDAWWERQTRRALGLVTTAADATASLTARFLRQHAASEGVLLDPIRALPNREAIDVGLRVTGPVAFKKHMTLTGDPASSLRVMGSQLSGSAASRALDGDRETFMRTFTERPQLVGYRRVSLSGSPCFWCAMLISRGAVYSKESADFQAHKPNCRCSAVPLYGHEDEPPEVVAARELWESSTVGKSGKAAVRAFRRAWDTREATDGRRESEGT
jgi:hypothetical protein